MKEWYRLNVEEVLLELGITKAGLTETEAEARIGKFGENTLEERKQKSLLQVFASQFLNLLVVILVVAALISMFSGNLESTVVIIAVIILNAAIGTVQYSKAEKSLEALKSLSAPCAKVLRDGMAHEIPAARIVPGDVILLEAGDLVPADARVLDSFSLQVNESSLTGESVSSEKTAEPLDGDRTLADRTNMVYASGLVTYGRAVAVAVSTAMHTEIGKIASLMSRTKQKKTPLEESLDRFSAKLAFLIILTCLLVFSLSVSRGMAIPEALLFAVALAVAAIPEALGSIVTIVQAIGTKKMANEHAVIKQLKAVESLGCVSVICSDKTGTLTQNKMAVQKLYVDGKILAPADISLANELHRYLLYNAVLTNDASFVDGKWIGDPTEYSLLAMADQIKLPHQELRSSMERLDEIPFDSGRKMMTTKYEFLGTPMILTKGALDVLLEQSTRIHLEGGVCPMTGQHRDEIQKANRIFSESGLRVLAFCYKEADRETHLTIEDECDYIFLGLISMMDPPREESQDAVSDAKSAGIKPVMITGDHKITATAIAKQIGIFEEGDRALTGIELDALPDSELDKLIGQISVYARVSPENKIRIVEAWQRCGKVVAMTGDGVNDAPALKKADIGIAMGITGTEVSKDAAAMILTDDNFATIIKAVSNGRNVYRNIKNAIGFLLSGNAAGILAVLYASLAALPVPFAAVHLLFINLITDSLPAIAIGMEPPERDLLKMKPRDPKEGILTRDFILRVMVQGAIIAACTLTAFYIGLSQGNPSVASTMAFATLALARLWHGFNCRSTHSIFRIGFSGNKSSLYAFLLGVLLLNVVLFVPVLQELFSVENLTLQSYGYICILSFIPTFLIQTYKILHERNII